MNQGAGTERVSASYLIETPGALERAAETIAGEQSSGTFVPLPGETGNLQKRHRARVESIEELEVVGAPAVAGRYGDARKFRRGHIVISWPLENVGPSLPNLLPMLFGNLSELVELSGIRLLDFELPDTYVAACPLPRFGIDGTRMLAAVPTGPIVGTIVKPSVGLSPRETADLVSLLAVAGIDFVKDDELMASPPYSPLEQRVELVMQAIDEAAARTGRKVMFAFNITGEVDEMRRRHEVVVNAGGTCVMISLNAVGLTGFSALAAEAAVPIHGHRNGWGMLTRAPLLGIEFTAYQRLWRLAGVDHLHVNGLASKFWEPDDSIVRSALACLTPIRTDTDRAMPVFSSGQWGGQAPATYAGLKSVDLIYLAGGGIMAHPSGPAAGVAAIRQAWEAAIERVELTDHARNHPELAQAIATFDRRS
jgi:ribulose-bisphosphate carboxylase large chain